MHKYTPRHSIVTRRTRNGIGIVTVETEAIETAAAMLWIINTTLSSKPTDAELFLGSLSLTREYSIEIQLHKRFSWSLFFLKLFIGFTDTIMVIATSARTPSPRSIRSSSSPNRVSFTSNGSGSNGDDDYETDTSILNRSPIRRVKSVDNQKGKKKR